MAVTVCDVDCAVMSIHFAEVFGVDQAIRVVEDGAAVGGRVGIGISEDHQL